jgi:hypothetical protein
MKLAGKPGAGKLHAGFDVAGAGNGLSEHRASPRPYLRKGLRKAPALHSAAFLEKSLGANNENI